MTYRPEINGLRAIALLSVLFFHADFLFFSGGFVGVDVFFVISGYLITSIILFDLQKNSFSLKNFYERRFRRIVPALLFVILVSVPLAYLTLSPFQMRDFFRSLIYTPVFLSNITFYKHSGYFDLASEFKPLLHTWSLAIEEQYYILFPLMILIAWKFSKRTIPIIFFVLAIFSFCFAQYQLSHNPQAAFYLLPSRIWELLAGALIAHYLFEKQQQSNRYLDLLGVFLIAASIFIYDKETPFPGLFALLPVIGSSLILVFCNKTTFTGRFLSHRYMVAIGLISYSTYLWHQPLNAFAKILLSNNYIPYLSLYLCLLALLLGAICWKYIEVPFRQKISLSKVILVTLSSSLVIIAFGLFGYYSSWYESNFYQRLSLNDKKIYTEIKSRNNQEAYIGIERECYLSSEKIDQVFEDKFLACTQKYGQAIIILGDSHAINIYNIYRMSQVKPFVVGLYKGGCRPYDNKKDCPFEEFNNFMKKYRDRVDRIIYHQAGQVFLSLDRGARLTDINTIFTDNKPFFIKYGDIKKIDKYLADLSLIHKVIWLGPFVEPRINFEDYKFFRQGYRLSDRAIEVFHALDQHLILNTGNQRSYGYLSFDELFKIEPSFLKVGDCITYRDIDHLSPCGEKIVSQSLKRLNHHELY